MMDLCAFGADTSQRSWDNHAHFILVKIQALQQLAMGILNAAPTRSANDSLNLFGQSDSLGQ